MSVQLLLLASLPALGWGLMPIVAKLMGGKSEEQLLGTTIAALIFGSVFGFLNQVSYAMVPFFISLLSGVFGLADNTSNFSLWRKRRFLK